MEPHTKSRQSRHVSLARLASVINKELTPEQRWADEFLGRLWDLPGVVFQECKTSVQDYWRRAPPALRKRASRAMDPWKREVWKVLRERLPTRVVPQVPVWIEAERVGYVLDFFIPELSVSVSLQVWEERFDTEDLFIADVEAEPDHPLNDNRPHDLRECEGIEDLRYWDVTVQEDGARSIACEVRKELGYGRPPWLHRETYLEPSNIAPADG